VTHERRRPPRFQGLKMDRRQILIVEDSPTMRQLLVFALRRLKNVEIVEAQDGMDGLRKVSSDHFDLALIDINMPVMDGLKLISLIRSDDNLKDISICVITTEGAKEDRAPALSLGGIEALTLTLPATRVLAVAKSLLKID
jgi:two-component system chemotaxis response regulator CheY